VTPTKTPIPDPETPVVRLNEVLPLPRSVDWNGDGQLTQADAWLELYNTADGMVDLSGWRLEIIVGEDSGNDHYLIPAGTSLQPAGYLVLYPLQKEMSLAEEGMIRLLDNEGTLIDRVILPELPADTSYSLDAATGIWHADWPATPGRPNTPPELAPQTLPNWENIPE
jgi:hypothetical protein